MESFLTELYANSTGPLVSAIILGLLMATAPCPMTINITAIAYIGKDIGNRKRIFYNGLFYALGTIFSYTSLALILYIGADKFRLASLFEQYSEKIIGPLLLVIGILMLGVLNINIPIFSKLTERIQYREKHNFRDAFLLGLVLALAFCPYSGVLFFGTLVPLTISTSTIYLPLVFSMAASIPVVMFAWLLAFSVAGVGKMFNRIKVFEFWFSKGVAVLFIGIGIYYIIDIWF